MEWLFSLALYIVIHMRCGYGSVSCPPFKIHYSNLALENPANFTGDCPAISVASESSCLEEFCNIYYSKLYNNCRGNAVQFTQIGNTSICYIMKLYHCTSATGCKLQRDESSKIYIADDPMYYYTAAVPECTPDLHFQCKRDGKCIPISRQCDGELTCVDGSDEMGCKQYLNTRTTDKTMLITAVAVGAVLSLLLIVLMFACGQRLYVSHYERRTRLRNLRLGSSGADYVVRLLPGEAPFQDTLPPSYTDSVLLPSEEPPIYEPVDDRDRLLDLAETSGGYLSGGVESVKLEEDSSTSKLDEDSSKLEEDSSKLEEDSSKLGEDSVVCLVSSVSSVLSEPGPSSFQDFKLDDIT